MKWTVQKAELAGDINIPASKSHTIRALLIATLAKGTSTIKDPLLTGDGESALVLRSGSDAKKQGWKACC